MDDIAVIRGAVFMGVFVCCFLLQLRIPSRKITKERVPYMASNLLIVFMNNLVLSILPILPYSMAVIVEEKSYGILQVMEIPKIVTIILGIVLLDMAIYFQHRAFHKIDFLWKIHSMHHTDPMLDVTSGLRFHPIEILLSSFIKVGVIIAIGIPAMAVIIFEITLNALAMFNHSNMQIPSKIEKVINKVLITPAIHTIHHSKRWEETNTNYGFSVPWWDMLFGTYVEHGKYSQEKIHIGIVPMPKKNLQILPGMLLQPFSFWHFN